MAVTVDFLAFANDPAANVMTQAAYLATATGGIVQYGFSSGLAASNQCNKVWRQSSVMTAAIANLIGATLNANVLDSGGAASITALQAQLTSTIQALAVASAPPLTPQGRLTPVTATPVSLADVLSSTVVYYTAYTGNYIPVWNGTQYINLQFATDLVLTLTAAATANSIVDVFAINVASAPVLGFGPVWATSTPGAGARGSGAGTTALQRTNGLLTNANAITLYNGASTYAGIAAGQATYLGSISVDAVAGQTTCHRTYGQSRKFGVWNAYNRVPIILKGGDSTASWTYATNTWRPSNNATGNSIQTFCGLAEEQIDAKFLQEIAGNSATMSTAIGLNSTTAPTDLVCSLSIGANFPNLHMISNISYNTLGINTVTSLEKTTSTTPTYYGTSSSMLLQTNYRG